MQILDSIPKFILVSIISRKISEKESFLNLEEVGDLVESYGGQITKIVLQKREVHDKGSYIGLGKIQEISEIIRQQPTDVIVLNGIVKPGQIYDLFEIWSKINPKIEVWDRVDLILKIFDKQANTAEAKLQIELAAMHHMGPRIYGMGMELSRQGGGIGTRGIGETNTEIMKRHFRTQIKKAQEKLSKLAAARQAQLKKRQAIGLKTVSLVGYTNAGKTSLFNLLTGKHKYVENKLFATLDATVGPIYLPPIQSEILVSDTIGFIRDLPPNLIQAFKSTLMETAYADLLLHIVDVSDKQVDQKIEVVEMLLKSLGLTDKKTILILNKSDLVTASKIRQFQKKYTKYQPLSVSSLTGQGVQELLNSFDLA